MNALTELWWASLLIALPALFVLVYQRGEKDGQKQSKPTLVVLRNELPRDLNITGRQMRQKQMDDRIFNTVKEFRNGVD